MIEDHAANNLRHLPNCTVLTDDGLFDRGALTNLGRLTDHTVCRHLCLDVDKRPPIGL
jgi:hypothetical protein